jgi:uncharacterized protein
MVYEPRLYRESMKTPGLVSCVVVEDETDLYICGEVDLSTLARKAVSEVRGELNAYISVHPEFAETLEPYDVSDDAPDIVKTMAAAGKAAGVGPMAAVAGAIAEYVGRACLKMSQQVIVENGGDIFLAAPELRRLTIFAGESPLSERLSLIIKPNQTPIGVCTSSGTVGHSISFGQADAAVAISSDTALADAWATRLGNLVHTQDDLEKTIKAAQNASGLTGAIIIIGDKMAVWGDIELEPLK